MPKVILDTDRREPHALIGAIHGIAGIRQVIQHAVMLDLHPGLRKDAERIAMDGGIFWTLNTSELLRAGIIRTSCLTRENTHRFHHIDHVHWLLSFIPQFPYEP